MTNDLEHLRVRPSVLYFGTPVALITTLSEDGSSNISPMSSAWALGDRVVLGLSSTSKGAENARRERELVINLPSPDLWSKVEAIARSTGQVEVPAHKRAIGYHHEADKWSEGGFTMQASEFVRPPRIAECPLQFEAEVMAAQAPTDWPAQAPESFWIVETRVKAIHARADIVMPGTEHIDTERWSPLLYVFRHYFGTGPDLGSTFKAER